MADRIIDRIGIELPTNRRDLRKTIVEWFLNEEPGTGKGENTSRYTYNVEKLSDGQVVFLRRPAWLKKGFDFTVNVNNTNFNINIVGKKATRMPSHNHILDDLRKKKDENINNYKRLLIEINKIYNCEQNIDYTIDFETGYASDLILKSLKWLFIEQDIRDWNYSGRVMLYEGIKNI